MIACGQILSHIYSHALALWVHYYLDLLITVKYCCTA